jgi:hypothetical protein
MRTYTHPTERSQPAARRNVWSCAALVPLGYAATRGVLHVSPDARLAALFLVAILLGGAHRLVPGLVEVGAGTVGLVASVFAATGDSGCGKVLGGAGTGVVLVYGGVMSASAFVRLLGSVNGREMARHLVAATAALELGVLVVSPGARSIVDTEDGRTVAIVLAGALLAATLTGIRSRVGFPLLGVGLIMAQGMHALSSNPCAVSPALTLVGVLAFAGAGTLVVTRHRGGHDLADDDPDGIAFETA